MKQDTIIAHAGRHPQQQMGAVNPPVYHVSTVTHATVADLQASNQNPYEGLHYGRIGTPTSLALEEAVCALEGGYRSIATASGLAAITGTLSALLSAGDHVLAVDSVYSPTRRFCNDQLARCGVKTTYYAPDANIDTLIRPETRVVIVESPGSLTFEVQDIPAIAAVAHRQGALVVMDNTWATPLYFKPFEKGVDVSIQAATKFIVGHSDAMLGVITCVDPDLWHRIKHAIVNSGVCAGTDEAYLGQRGLRTLAVRLRQHEQSGMALATWLQARPEVARVLHPGLPDDPGHALWKRDFLGACGLFSVELDARVSVEQTNTLINGLRLFGIGYSWGGFESLIIPTSGAILRTVVPWVASGPTLRIHTELEDPDDLIADLAAGLDGLRLDAGVTR